MVRLAQNAEEVGRAQRLRFEVFNLELNEGLVESHFTGLDVDLFDNVCDHLIVEDVATDEIVGTYRLQTGARAAANIGYYSEREFDFTPYEPLRGEMIELGRACAHAEHRNFNVLHLLWGGIARYAFERNARFLIGCSSLTSQDPMEGVAMYEQLLGKHLVRPKWRTVPHPAFRVDVDLVSHHARRRSSCARTCPSAQKSAARLQWIGSLAQSTFLPFSIFMRCRRSSARTS